jgi:hypothetical protein
LRERVGTFVTNCEQRKLSNSVGGGSLYGGRARSYDSGSARRALPILSPCRAVGVNSEGLLKSESDEYILAKQSLAKLQFLGPS